MNRLKPRQHVIKEIRAEQQQAKMILSYLKGRGGELRTVVHET